MSDEDACLICGEVRRLHSRHDETCPTPSFAAGNRMIADEVIYPPRGYGIGFFFGGEARDTIVGSWATAAEAREALSHAAIVYVGPS